MAKRRRPVIAYVTSERQNATGNIAQDAIRQFVDQLADVDPEAREIDLIVNSFGGDGLTSWRLITMVREYLGGEGRLTCFVPYYAFSAATLIAVGCDEIFMHPLASLGPVDPQITVNRKEGPQQFAYEDVAAYTSFLQDEGGSGCTKRGSHRGEPESQLLQPRARRLQKRGQRTGFASSTRATTHRQCTLQPATASGTTGVGTSSISDWYVARTSGRL